MRRESTTRSSSPAVKDANEAPASLAVHAVGASRRLEFVGLSPTNSPLARRTSGTRHPGTRASSFVPPTHETRTLRGGPSLAVKRRERPAFTQCGAPASPAISTPAPSAAGVLAVRAVGALAHPRMPRGRRRRGVLQGSRADRDSVASPPGGRPWKLTPGGGFEDHPCAPGARACARRSRLAWPPCASPFLTAPSVSFPTAPPEPTSPPISARPRPCGAGHPCPRWRQDGEAGRDGVRRRPDPRPRRAADRRPADRDRHRQGGRRRRAQAAASRHRARARGVGAGALSRDQGVHRPADR